MFIPSPYTLAIFIKDQRQKLGLSQKEVAAMVGLQQKTISALENNPAGIKLDTFFRILAALELEMDLSWKKEAHKNKTKWTEEW